MTFTILPYTTRPEWLNLRRQGLGASDIAAVVGVSPWTTPRQVWLSKVEPDTPEPISNEDMEWGLRMERLIIAEALDRIGCGIHREGPLLRNLKRPWMMATLDAIAFLKPHAEPDDLGQAIIEAKKVDEWNWPDGPPTHYNYQVQWQLAVTGYQKGWIAALHRGRRLELYPIARDEEVITELIAAGERFWLDHVVPVEPPPVTAADDPFLSLQWPQHIEAAVEVDEDLAAELRAAKAGVKAATERLQLAEARVKEIMGEASTAVTPDGETLATWKTSESRRVNVTMLRAEEPDIAETYTKVSKSRRFLVKEDKE